MMSRELPDNSIVRTGLRLSLLLLCVLLLHACGTEDDSEPIGEPESGAVHSDAAKRNSDEVNSAAQVTAADAPTGFVHIPSGAFQMGNNGAYQDAVNEGPHHTVGISQFFIGINEVTQAEYLEHMPHNPSQFKGDDHPVQAVTWYEAVEYCNKRSLAEGLTPSYAINGTSVQMLAGGKGYRLPTEAEWEYACRAGSPSDLSNGDLTLPPFDCENVDPMLGKMAWYCANSGGTTHPVGLKNANGLGLRGMHGNVAEWCWDFFAIYGGIDTENPTGPEQGRNRVVRGGAYKFPAAECRSSRRIPLAPDMNGLRRSTIGFRLVLPIN